MPRRPIELVSNEFYHIYNRGNNKERIFFEEKNYTFFLERFAYFVSEGNALLHVFCLMPNHFHFLLQILDSRKFQKSFARFLISYVKSVNAVYGRGGHLFEGRFKAKLIENDEYLLHLSRYIHLNPVFATLVKRAEDWKFSSYRDYIHEKPTRNMVHTEYILSKFSDANEYRDFVDAFAEEELQRISAGLWK